MSMESKILFANVRQVNVLIMKVLGNLHLHKAYLKSQTSLDSFMYTIGEKFVINILKNVDVFQKSSCLIFFVQAVVCFKILWCIYLKYKCFEIL